MNIAVDNGLFLLHFAVSPLAGEWIEIGIVGIIWSKDRVSPLAGEWIEINTLPHHSGP